MEFIPIILGVVIAVIGVIRMRLFAPRFSSILPFGFYYRAQQAIDGLVLSCRNTS